VRGAQGRQGEIEFARGPKKVVLGPSKQTALFISWGQPREKRKSADFTDSADLNPYLPANSKASLKFEGNVFGSESTNRGVSLTANGEIVGCGLTLKGFFLPGWERPGGTTY